MKSKNTSYKSRVNAIYPSLKETDKKIADYISENIKVVSHSTISKIADIIGVADSTIFKFTKLLGYDGFTDFKIALLTEDFDPTITINNEIQDEDDEEEIAKKIFESGKVAIDNAISLIDGNEYKKAVDLLVNADKVVFFGLGGSNVMALEAYHLFLRSPINCLYNGDYDMQTMTASLLTKNDVAVIISHSGRTSGAIEIENICKENKVPIISITSNKLSPIAKASDVILLSSANNLAYRTESTPSKISQYSIINTLFVMTMLKDNETYDKTLKTVHSALNKVEKNR